MVSVDEAFDEVQTVEAVRKRSGESQPGYAFVLLDVTMPVMGGREIRRQRYADPMIAVTGSGC